MEAYASDPLGRAPGEMLWPDYFTDDMLRAAKLNPRSWNALYQQRPSPDDGTFFQRAWFKTWAAKPAHLNIYGTSDYAVTDSGGDFTVHRVWGVDALGDLYRLDGWRGQTTADVWIDKKLDLMKRHKPLAWFGESGVIQKAVQPMLTSRMRERSVYCRMEWLPSITDKPTRARGFQARAASGRVYFEPGADLDEFLKFPAGKNDDDVDCASLIGRALDDAHPAIVPVQETPKPADRWARAFEDQETNDWKTA
jgi:predicted phage terminase large subunit-like protein